ncbi:hypothetical protein ACWIGY_37725 [Streptomyces anulatus]
MWRPRKDSPGYTDHQRSEVARMRAEVLRLSAVVSTHPFWETVENSKVEEARMRLKHAHESAAEA